MAKSEEELKSLLMKMKKESEKAGLKLNIQKTKIVASGPITSWQVDRETMETVTDFLFLGSKITANGDCSHEIKRCLLLGRKAMTNLQSMLKSRDITLLTKVYLVKSMVFPVVCTGFPCGSAGKESTCNAGDLGSIPGLERSPGEEKGYPLQYSGLENSTDCIVHMVAKSGTRPINFHSLTWAKALHLPRSLVPYNRPQLCPTGWIRSSAFHPCGFPQGARTGLKSLLYPADFLHLSLKESRMNSMSAHAKGQNHHSPCSRGPSITFFFFPATLSGAQGQRKGMKKKESESESRSVVSSSLQHNGLYCPWNSLGQNNGVSSLSLLQGIFPTQVSNPGLPHCRRILYQLSHKGSP